MQASDRVNVTHAELEDVPSNGTTSLVSAAPESPLTAEGT
jgi:hypothetical protein